MAPPVAIRRCCRQRLQQKVEALLFAGLFYKKTIPITQNYAALTMRLCRLSILAVNRKSN
jgi:hypothetical protein